jgi:hypothetical protein
MENQQSLQFLGLRYLIRPPGLRANEKLGNLREISAVPGSW